MTLLKGGLILLILTVNEISVTGNNFFGLFRSLSGKGDNEGNRDRLANQALAYSRYCVENTKLRLEYFIKSYDLIRYPNNILDQLQRSIKECSEHLRDLFEYEDYKPLKVEAKKFEEISDILEELKNIDDKDSVEWADLIERLENATNEKSKFDKTLKKILKADKKDSSGGD